MSDFVEMEFEWQTKTCIIPFKRQPHKMIKHAIRRQKPMNGVSVFDHFVGLMLKGLKTWEERYFGVYLSVSPRGKVFLKFFL